MWFGGGEGGKDLFCVPCPNPFGGTSCWDDRPSKRGNIGEGTLSACHRKRERAFKATAEQCHGGQKQKRTCLCLARASYAQRVVGKHAQTRQRPLEGKMVKERLRQAL